MVAGGAALGVVARGEADGAGVGGGRGIGVSGGRATTRTVVDGGEAAAAAKGRPGRDGGRSRGRDGGRGRAVTAAGGEATTAAEGEAAAAKKFHKP
jgi:hypothetical protein